eukprot:SAG11_NODE_21546_length_423_cov_0.796296_1_plen_65_part_10
MLRLGLSLLRIRVLVRIRHGWRVHCDAEHTRLAQALQFAEFVRTTVRRLKSATPNQIVTVQVNCC